MIREFEVTYVNTRTVKVWVESESELDAQIKAIAVAKDSTGFTEHEEWAAKEAVSCVPFSISGD